MPAARAHAVAIAPAVRHSLGIFGTTHDAPAARWSAGDELEEGLRHVNALAVDVEHDVGRRARGDPVPCSSPQGIGSLALESRPVQLFGHGWNDRRAAPAPIGRFCGSHGRIRGIRAPSPTPATDALSFTVQPSSAIATQIITPAIQVTVLDSLGNTDPNFTAAVTIAIRANPVGGNLSGAKSVAPVNGIASFGDLSIGKAGAGYTLRATAPGATAATSGSFTITSQ